MSKSTNEAGEGGDALIHLRVPAALKARWVRDSRAAGRKLTEWIVDRVEAQAVNGYPIPEALASAYNGAGYALAAITNGQVVALRYLADHADESTQDALSEGGAHARRAALAWIASDAAGPIVRELQALGNISVGMCSSWEFVEL